MVEKDLNLFDECVAECVHLCPQVEECISSTWGDSKMYTPDIIANSQRMPTKIKNNGAIAGGISDTIRHWKIFRIFSEIPALLVLFWWYFSCLHIYSDKYFNIYLNEQMFFKIFVATVDTG